MARRGTIAQRVDGGVTNQALTQGVAQALAQATDTRQILVRPGASGGVADCFATCFGRRAAVVVADETTYDVGGQAVDRLLRASGRSVLEPLVFPARPARSAQHPLHADYHHVLWLHEALAAHEAIPVAVGSGTLNDLTKLAAHLAGRPYMVVATAASMDGYAAFGAAITRDGFKQTMACAAPRAVVADVDVLTAAPAELTASGFGDLMGKLTAGADWLLADALGVEPIEPAIWSTVQPAAREAIAEPHRLRARDAAAVERLFLCLTMSGLAMQAARSSRPASGSEHQFSHLWEMRGPSLAGAAASHGFKVGIGTMAVAALYERLLERDLGTIDVEALCRRWPSVDQLEAEVRQTHADPALREQALAESRAKYVSPGHLRPRLRRLQEAWPALRARLRAQLLPPDEVRRLLRAAGCPTDPGEIGITQPGLRASYAAARQIRRRYTVLDFAAETDLLGPSLDELFGPGGYWDSRASGGGPANRDGAAARVAANARVGGE